METQYNELPTDVKVLIVNAKTLVEETKERIKSQPGRVDLTCRLQLRDDCNAIERAIKKVAKRCTEKEIENLRLSIVRLQTSANGILAR